MVGANRWCWLDADVWTGVEFGAVGSGLPVCRRFAGLAPLWTTGLYLWIVDYWWGCGERLAEEEGGEEVAWGVGNGGLKRERG